MPTLLAVERKIVEVAKAVLVPLKYGICPAVPVTPVMADVPLPWRRPVKVEAPVPPSDTVKSVIPVIVPPVMLAFEDQKVGKVAYVVEAFVAVSFVTENGSSTFKVAPLKVKLVPSVIVACLLLKVFQSVVVRKPETEAEEVAMVI